MVVTQVLKEGCRLIIYACLPCTFNDQSVVYLDIDVVANFVNLHVTRQAGHAMLPEVSAKHVARTAPISFRVSHGA